MQSYKKMGENQIKTYLFYALWEIITNFAAGKESIGWLFARRR